jgi:hypothetical protein
VAAAGVVRVPVACDVAAVAFAGTSKRSTKYKRTHLRATAAIGFFARALRTSTTCAATPAR